MKIPAHLQEVVDITKSYAHEVAVNTAQVTFCFTTTYPGANVLVFLDVLARAGQALREVEGTPGFKWAEQVTDFESCCQQLAESAYTTPGRKHFGPVVRNSLHLP